MRRLLVVAGLTAAAALPEAISGQSLPDPVLALTSARLIDVVTGTVIPRGLVLVRSGRIAAVGSRDSIRIPAGSRVLDLGDATLLPGLIDAHVHLLLGGPPRANAEATLRAGFTESSSAPTPASCRTARTHGSWPRWCAWGSRRSTHSAQPRFGRLRPWAWPTGSGA